CRVPAPTSGSLIRGDRRFSRPHASTSKRSLGSRVQGLATTIHDTNPIGNTLWQYCQRIAAELLSVEDGVWTKRGTLVSSQTPTFRRMLLGHRLRELRTSTGLTAKAVSEELEVAASWVTRIENGERGIQIRDLRRLFDLY